MNLLTWARAFAIVGGIAILGGGPGPADTVYWSDNGTDWGTGSSWIGGSVPGPSRTAGFQAGSYAYQPSVGGSQQSVSAVQVDSASGTVTISGGTGGSLLIGSGNLWVSSAAGLTISTTVDGNAGLTKNGSGTLVLSATNAYSGSTAITAGTLRAGGPDLPALPIKTDLQLWLDGADASTVTADGNGYVSQWADKSGYGNHLVQDVDGSKPRYVAEAMGGNGVMRFDGNQMIGTNYSVGNPYTIFSVSRVDNSVKTERLITANNNWLLGYWGGMMNMMHADGWVSSDSGPQSDAAVHYYGASCDGSTTTFFDGNTQLAASSNGSSSPDGLSLGAWGEPTNETTRGDVAEILLYSRVLDSSDQGAVVGYLKSKWGGGGVFDRIPDASATTITAGAILDLNNYSETVGPLAGSGGVALGTGGKLTTNSTAGHDTEFSGVISGGGSLVKSGPATLVLSGANTHAGGTTINAGTLSVSTDGNLGDAAAILTLNGGVLKTAGPVISSRPVALNTGSTIDTNGFNSTFSGVVSGTGPWTKAGTGVLTLRGVSTFTGPVTVTGGTLRGDTSALAAPVILAGTSGSPANLILEQAADGMLTRPISGNGSFTKTGAGVLTLRRSNAYTGATNILQGELKLSALPQLPVTAALQLWLDAADAATVAVNGSSLIDTWSDKSGNNRNVVQNNDAHKPAYVEGAMAGNAVARFDGNDVIGNSYSVGNPYTIFSASRVDNSAKTERLITANNNWLLGYWGGMMNIMYAEGWVSGSGPTPDTAVHLYGATGTGSTTMFYDGNTQLASNSNGAASPVGLSLGGWQNNPDTNENTRGDLAEIVLYNRVLDESERTAVVHYLTSKWITGDAGGGVTDLIPDTSPVTIFERAILNLNDCSETVGSLAGGSDGIVLLGLGTLTVNSTGGSPDSTFSGTITGDGALVKMGAGKLTLDGDSGYTGGTTVTKGTLAIGRMSALPAGRGLTIEAGSTVVLASGLSATGASAVPEPSTLALLGIGAMGLLGRGWRRRTQTA